MNRHGLSTAAASAVALLLLLSCAVAALAQGGGARPQASNSIEGAGARTADGARAFRGWVGKYPVRMRLRRGAGGELSGSYSYEGRGGELALKGTVNPDGEFTLDEFDGAKRTGTFKGRWRERNYEPQASIEGDWTKPGGGAESFSLSEELAGGARLTEKRIKEAGSARRPEVEVAYPQVDGAAAFNRIVYDFVTKEVGDFRQSAGGGPDNVLQINYSMRLLTDELLSAQFTTSRLVRGMAHADYSMRVVNYDLKSGRLLRLADLFRPGSNYLQKISAAAIARLQEMNREDGDMYLADPETRAGASPRPENYRNWTLTARGLAVTFEPYQVGPFAAGAPSVLIPYAELRDMIRAGGPLASLSK